MVIRVQTIEKKNDAFYVTGVTDIGMIKGKWCYREAPVIDEYYHVELGLEAVDRKDVSVVADCEQSFESCVRIDDDNMIFQAHCEEYDETYILRIDGGLEMLEICNDDGTIHEGDVICFQQACETLGIYPYEL